MGIKGKILIIAAIIIIILVIVIYSRRKKDRLGRAEKKVKIIQENNNYPGEGIEKIYLFARERWGGKIEDELGIMIIIADKSGFLQSLEYKKINEYKEIESHLKKQKTGSKIIILRNLIRGTHYPAPAEQEIIKRIAESHDLYDYMIINKQFYYSAKATGILNNNT